MGQTTGGSGFRLDAIKHMDRDFLLQWVSKLTKPYFDTLVTIRPAQIKLVRIRDGRSRAFMVAEYWSPKSI
jgi:alpha-amylase